MRSFRRSPELLFPAEEAGLNAHVGAAQAEHHAALSYDVGGGGAQGVVFRLFGTGAAGSFFHRRVAAGGGRHGRRRQGAQQGGEVAHEPGVLFGLVGGAPGNEQTAAVDARGVEQGTEHFKSGVGVAVGVVVAAAADMAAQHGYARRSAGERLNNVIGRNAPRAGNGNEPDVRGQFEAVASGAFGAEQGAPAAGEHADGSFIERRLHHEGLLCSAGFVPRAAMISRAEGAEGSTAARHGHTAAQEPQRRHSSASTAHLRSSPRLQAPWGQA